MEKKEDGVLLRIYLGSVRVKKKVDRQTAEGLLSGKLSLRELLGELVGIPPELDEKKIFLVDLGDSLLIAERVDHFPLFDEEFEEIVDLLSIPVLSPYSDVWQGTLEKIGKRIRETRWLRRVYYSALLLLPLSKFLEIAEKIISGKFPKSFKRVFIVKLLMELEKDREGSIRELIRNRGRLRRVFRGLHLPLRRFRDKNGVEWEVKNKLWLEAASIVEGTHPTTQKIKKGNIDLLLEEKIPFREALYFLRKKRGLVKEYLRELAEEWGAEFIRNYDDIKGLLEPEEAEMLREIALRSAGGKPGEISSEEVERVSLMYSERVADRLVRLGIVPILLVDESGSMSLSSLKVVGLEPLKKAGFRAIAFSLYPREITEEVLRGIKIFPRDELTCIICAVLKALSIAPRDKKVLFIFLSDMYHTKTPRHIIERLFEEARDRIPKSISLEKLTSIEAPPLSKPLVGQAQVLLSKLFHSLKREGHLIAVYFPSFSARKIFENWFYTGCFVVLEHKADPIKFWDSLDRALRKYELKTKKKHAFLWALSELKKTELERGTIQKLLIEARKTSEVPSVKNWLELVEIAQKIVG